MAEYLLKDRDKAAFINHMNKLLGQMDPSSGLDSSNFIDVPGDNRSEDKTIFATDDPREISMLDTLINNGAFMFRIKKIDLKEMVRKSNN